MKVISEYLKQMIDFYMQSQRSKLCNFQSCICLSDLSSFDPVFINNLVLFVYTTCSRS